VVRLSIRREPVGEHLGRFARALERARMERLDLLACETSGERGDFDAATCGKPD